MKRDYTNVRKAHAIIMLYACLGAAPERRFSMFEFEYPHLLQQPLNQTNCHTDLDNGNKSVQIF